MRLNDLSVLLLITLTVAQHEIEASYLFLPSGRTTLGHGPMDISIQGPGVAAQHCYIENRSGVITLHPCGNLCAVDAIQIRQPTRLSQGRSRLSHVQRYILLLVQF